jgi:hypothetical protein
MELTQRILDYYDKHLSEGSYLDELAGSVAVDDLFAATVELLQSSIGNMNRASHSPSSPIDSRIIFMN